MPYSCVVRIDCRAAALSIAAIIASNRCCNSARQSALVMREHIEFVLADRGKNQRRDIRRVEPGLSEFSKPAASLPASLAGSGVRDGP